MALVAGSRLGPYEVLGLLGAGGMGEVYRARDPRLGREVAVKVLPEEVAGDPERLQRFEREARAVAALSHPNILTVFDVGTQEGVPYVVTELLEGETLRELLSRRAPTQRQVLFFLSQAAHGLEAAHAKGIVHRDVKPENLFVTTDGRVKLLDFGLAKASASVTRSSGEVTESSPTGAGQVLGTVGYMSPEQVRGLPVDHRTDIFSFGVTAYELLSGKHPFRRETTIATLTAILEDTPAELSSLARSVPPALSGIVQRCLAKGREERFRSAHDLALSLESVLSAPVGAASLDEVEVQSPYPGLSSFTEKDAAQFFGREAEIRALWQRLQNRKLLAVIGPSGTGKTSFVRAGVIPAAPEGWRCLWVTPGNRPFPAVARALVPELSSDPETLQRLVGAETGDVLLAALGPWRRRHGEALLVVDQFEELFTLNLREVQERFAAFLGQLASEGDVHVLVSLRDDFLMRSQEHAPLRPILADLTALLPLPAEALRRALVEPARKRGYRFEDEALVEEMVESVEGARAALPLLAFAVARLWEKRDRERKLLTRQAYEEIGGVAGALAQHAEAMMDRVGTEQGVVREIFRNLVTAQGTRAVAEREELLSVFPDRKSAEAVLRELVDARLLTSYEVEGREGEGTKETHRVEIVHESLLKAWPRLVRWQAQDEEGAVLRDQLKQAAHLWEEKRRPADLLWTGTSYKEYELWRARYEARLTAVEQAFAGAMVAHAERRGRRRRLAEAAAFAGLIAVLAVIGVLLRRAVDEGRHAQASKLVALGRLELDRYPSAGLAYARKSLEIADTPEGREMAMEALWRAPTLRVLKLADRSWSGAFSPKGDRLAVYTFTDTVFLFPDDGREPRRIGGFPTPFGPTNVLFTPSGDVLVTSDTEADQFRAVSVPDGREILRFRASSMGDHAWCSSVTRALPDAVQVGVHAGSRPEDESKGTVRIVRWPFDGGPPHVVGSLPPGAAFDGDRSRIALVRADRRVVVRPWGEGKGAPERVLEPPLQGDVTAWRGAQPDRGIGFSPHGDWLAAAETTGRLSLWPIGDDPRRKPRLTRLANSDTHFAPAFDGPGRRLVWSSSSAPSVWHLDDPPDAEPLVLPRPGKRGLFHPEGRWLAVMSFDTVGFWALDQPRFRVIQKHTSPVSVLFSPDSRWLLSCGADGLGRWPLDPALDPSGVLMTHDWCYGPPAISRDGRRALVPLWQGSMLVSLAEGVTQPLDPAAPQWGVSGAALEPGGRRAATATWYHAPENKVLRVWDLATRTYRTFSLIPPGEDATNWYAWGVGQLEFNRQGRLLAAGAGGVRWIDSETGASQWIWKIGKLDQATMTVSGDGHWLVALGDLQQADGSLATKAILVDLLAGAQRDLAVRNGTTAMAFGNRSDVLVTGDNQGVVRVGRIDQAEPHILLRQAGPVNTLAVSPDGKWIASTSGNEIRLWPMPDVTKPPFHTLPHEELMAKLSALTNLRVVPDPSSSTGWKLDVGPFPGWKDAPTW